MKLATPDHNAIRGRVVIVTGAASGIGRALATNFTRDGALVVAVDRNSDGLDIMRADCQGHIDTLVGDVTDAAVLETAVARALTRHGRVDVLVNNAGFGLRRSIRDLAEGEFESVYAVHVLGGLYGIRAVSHVMASQGYGRIVSVISRAAEACQPGNAAYASAKAALWAVSRVAAAELVEQGILVNCLIPGMTNTAIWGRARPELQSPDRVYPTALALATLPAEGPSGRAFWDLAEYPLFERTIGQGVLSTPVPQP